MNIHNESIIDTKVDDGPLLVSATIRENTILPIRKNSFIPIDRGHPAALSSKAGVVVEKFTIYSEKLGLKTVDLVKNFGRISGQLIDNNMGSFGRLESYVKSLEARKGIFFKVGSFVEKESLDVSTMKNFSRFEKKLPVGAQEIRIISNGEKGYIFRAEVPGNVLGSSAVYEKEVDVLGKTVNYYKTSYDQNGNIIHIKDKVNGALVDLGDLE